MTRSDRSLVDYIWVTRGLTCTRETAYALHNKTYSPRPCDASRAVDAVEWRCDLGFFSYDPPTQFEAVCALCQRLFDLCDGMLTPEDESDILTRAVDCGVEDPFDLRRDYDISELSLWGQLQIMAERIDIESSLHHIRKDDYDE